MKEINLVDHPFRQRMMLEVGREYRGFGYEYFDSPESLTGFRGYRRDGNAAEGRRDFAAEARAISMVAGVRTVIDVGCAKGFLVKALRELGIEAFGVDVSEYAVGSADPGVRPFLRTTSVQEMSVDEQYDLVHVSGVLVYLTLSEIRKALRRFHEIARIGLIVNEPTREQFVKWYDQGDVSAVDPLRKQEISQTDWERLIVAAGFEKRTTWYRRLWTARDSSSVAVAARRPLIEAPGA